MNQLSSSTLLLAMAPVAVAGALLLYAHDPAVLAWIQQRRNRVSDGLAVAVKPLGDGRYTLPALALLILIGYFTRTPLALRVGMLAAVSFIFTGICCQVLQILTRRQRPIHSDISTIWEGPRLKSKHHSFPSGHASASASVLVAIGLLTSGLPLVAYGAFTLAVLTALSRLNDRMHWPSDVFAGSLIGSLIAYLTVHSGLLAHLLPAGSALAAILR